MPNPKPERIQRSRQKGFRTPPGTVYVGRPTKFGNPIVSQMVGGRRGAVEMFRHYLQLNPDLERQGRAELAGKNLSCWCPLDEPCHADVWLEVVNDGVRRVTIQDIELAIVGKLDPRRQLIIPNLSHALLIWGESDLVSISAAGFMSEYEIKTSVADLKRESKKRRWTNEFCRRSFHRKIKTYSVVVPEDIADRALELMPEYPASRARLLSVKRLKHSNRLTIRTMIKAKARRQVDRVTDQERIKLGELAAMRLWNCRLSRWHPF